MSERDVPEAGAEGVLTFQNAPTPAETDPANAAQHEDRSSQVREAIYKIAEAATSTSSLSDLYREIHQILEGLMPARNFYIALYDPESDTVSFPYFVDEMDPPPTTSESLKGLTGYIYRTGESLLVSPEGFAELLKRGVVEEVGAPSIDWMGVPLIVNQRTIGVMVIQTYVDGIRYSQDDLKILQFVSQQVAMAIDRQRAVDLLRESETRFRLLFENSPVGIYQTTEDGKILMANPALLKMLGFDSQEELSRRKLGVKSYAQPTSQTHFIEVLNRNGSVLGLESEWIKADGSIIHVRENARRIQHGGTVYFEGTVEDFTEKKISEERLLRSTQELAALHEVAIAASEETNEDSLIERATRVIGETVYSDHFGILLYELENQLLRPHYSYHGITQEDLQAQIPLGRGITGRVAQTGLPALVNDILDEPEFIQGHYPTMRSELCVPLKAGEKLLGVINAENVNPGAFNSYDLHLLTIFAGSVANAIDRYRSLAAERLQMRRLETIYDISQEIVGSSLEPELVYQAIHQAIAKLMPCEAMTIVIKTSDEWVDAVYSVDKSGRCPLSRFSMDHSLSGRVIRNGEKLIVNNMMDDERNFEVVHYGDPEHVKSILIVPMRVGKDIIGCLSTQSYREKVYTPDDLQMLELLAANAAIALENSKLFKETLQRAEELSVLVRVSSALRMAQSRSDMFPIILDQVCSLFKVSSSALALRDALQGDAAVELSSGTWKKGKGVRIPIGAGLIGKVIETGQAVFNSDIRLDAYEPLNSCIENYFNVAAVPLLVQEQTIGALWVGCDSPFSEGECRLLTAVSDIAANAIHRSTLNEQALHHAEQLAIVSATGRALSETLDIHEIYGRLVQSIYDLIPYTRRVWLSMFGLRNSISTVQYEVRRGKVGVETEIPMAQISRATLDGFDRVRKTLQPVICIEGCQDSNSPPVNGETYQGMYVPIIVKGGVLGVIRICGTHPYRFSGRDAELLALLANTAGIAIENARLFKETEQRLHRLSALRAMDMAIGSSFDLRVTLNVLLDQITAQLGVDAADVLLLNEFTQSLEYAAGRGFRSSTVTRTRLRLDEDLPGKAALERRLISLSGYPQYNLRTPRLAGEDFVAYYGVPLLAKGQLKGVLEIFHRGSLDPDGEWLEFLETLAGDTAIAIDNTTLFNELQRSNIELTLAYDTTLEGWSRLLELRRLEPEGHTQRILDLSLRLAIDMSISDSELLHIRRGVLLHDIGIMGVPRNILNKVEPLTDEEWGIIRKHPTYAYEIMSPIAYLRPALDIPYCHHEKWDGSGYPRGLRGNQIPLSARIFAVIDVWDSLHSDRPYRKAWPEDEILEYLRSQSGIHFDPQVVRAFLKLVSES